MNAQSDAQISSRNLHMKEIDKFVHLYLYLIGWSASQNPSTHIYHWRTERVMVDLCLYSELVYFIL